MSLAPNRRREPSRIEPSTVALLIGLIVVFLGLGSVWASVALGSRMDGVNPELPSDPFGIVFGLIRGRVEWPASGTWLLILMLVGIAVLAGLFGWLLRPRRQGARVDATARYMASSHELRAVTLKGATASAQRLGVTASPGVRIGRTVHGRQDIYLLWEWMLVAIAGPRTGKTTSLVVPAIVEAPGAVVTTSNKRDVVDVTRAIRAKTGDVWVFDPQKVANEEPTWWWNPLTYVTDDTQALNLAEHFASGSRAAGASTDAYFDNEGRNLLADTLLAAAIANEPISTVYSWLSTPNIPFAALAIEKGSLGGRAFPLQAMRLRGMSTMADKQRDGVFGTARQMAACLVSTTISPWVNPQLDESGVDPRPQFDPTEFVKGSGTLYSLSKEGQGSAGPLVTALTAATIEAAEKLATTQPGGRLTTPLLGVLDEAANVCRWKNLPDLYSHFGSRGIPIMSLFQSWSQGVDVFGREGMRKLWSASNAKVYLGGVAEAEFLRELAELIGDYDKETASVSLNGGGNRGTSHQLRRERIIDTAELAALPAGRGIVLTSGAPATLVETTPWMTGPRGAEIRASMEEAS